MTKVSKCPIRMNGNAVVGAGSLKVAREVVMVLGFDQSFHRQKMGL